MFNKLKLIFLLLGLIALSSCSKKLSCVDFKQGYFYVPVSEKVPFLTKIVRHDDFQTEIFLDPKNG